MLYGICANRLSNKPEPKRFKKQKQKQKNKTKQNKTKENGRAAVMEGLDVKDWTFSQSNKFTPTLRIHVISLTVHLF